MKKYLNICVSSVLAGVFIGVGVIVFLSVLPYSRVAGSLLFGLGLYTVIQFGLFLYTGKVGFVLDNRPQYFIDLAIGLAGNFAGIISLCLAMRGTRWGAALSEQARLLVSAKQDDKWYSILILSFMCGIMIYLGVKGYQKAESGIAKALMCYLSVSVFILCGFEHCVANAGYYALAGVINTKAIAYFTVMVIGNGIGSVTVDGLLKLKDRLG